MMEFGLLFLIVSFYIVGGIKILRAGRIQVSKDTVLEGWLARMIGVSLLSAVGLTVLTSCSYSWIEKAVGDPRYPEHVAPLWICASPLIVLPLVAAMIGVVYAKPIQNNAGVQTSPKVSDIVDDAVKSDSRGRPH